MHGFGQWGKSILPKAEKKMLLQMLQKMPPAENWNGKFLAVRQQSNHHTTVLLKIQPKLFTL